MKYAILFSIVALCGLFSCASSDELQPENPEVPAVTVDSEDEAASEQPADTQLRSQPEPGQSRQREAGIPQKWALLIGINDYLNQGFDLDGAVNDVELMEGLLTTKYDFPAQNIVKLLDKQAKRKAIFDTFDSHLVNNDNVKAGDVVVFYFSGHGSFTQDELDGDERGADDYDETILAHDSRSGGVYDITDDELNVLVSKLTAKNLHLTIIFDSCHSGTAVRGGKVRGVKPDPVLWSERTQTSVTEDDLDKKESVGSVHDEGAYVLLSAALAAQEAQEIDVNGKAYGAFTYYLVKALREVEERVTYKDILEKVSLHVRQKVSHQIPQIEGEALNNYLFDEIISGLPRNYAPVIAQDGREIKIGQGSVLDATKGSIYEVYPPYTIDFESTEKLAKVEINEVGTVASKAKLIEPRRTKIPLGSRALEVKHAYKGPKLNIFFKEESRSDLLQDVKRRLLETDYVQVVPDNKSFHFEISHQNGFFKIKGLNPIFYSPDVPENNPDRVINLIDGWRQWFSLLHRTQGTRESGVELILEYTDTRSGNTRGGKTFPEVGKHDKVATEGQQFKMGVTNHSEHNLYVYFLHLSSQGKIQVFPIRGDGEGGSLKVNAGNTYLTKSSYQFSLKEGQERTLDYLKVIASDVPLDGIDKIAVDPENIEATRGETRGNEEEEDPLQRSIVVTRSKVAPRLGNWATDQVAVLVVSKNN